MSEVRLVRIAGLLACVLAGLTLALTACQAMGRATPLPTLAPVLLPPEESNQRGADTVQNGLQANIQSRSTAIPPATSSAEPIGGVSHSTSPSPTPLAAPATATPAARVMAVGVRSSISLRASPGNAAQVIAAIPGSQVLWARGTSPDGKWLLVSYDDGGNLGWAAKQDVKLLGGSGNLDVVEAGTLAVPTVTRAGSGGQAGREASASANRPAPAGSTLKGKIVFQTSSGGDIYIVNADGTDLRRLADGMDPVLSPDGTRVAFTRWGTPHGVFIIDLRTASEQQVAGGNRPRSPTWSPDGTRLAFSYTTRDYTCRVSPFGCLEDDQLRDKFGGADCITTPSGRVCIEDLPSQQMEEYGLVQIDGAGGGWQDLPAQRIVQSPRWHPRRDEIVYRGDRGLQITEPTGQTRPLSDDPSWGSPAWSPDGGRIAAQKRLHDHMDIFLLDEAGNIQKRLTEPAPLERAPNNVAPAWSPDGHHILFLSDRGGAWRLYQMNADGSDQKLFLPGALRNLLFKYDFAAEAVASWGP